MSSTFGIENEDLGTSSPNTGSNKGEQPATAGENISTPIKLCHVCDDKAIGYNFGVIACESCKAFFRRALPRAQHLECAFEGKCNMNIKTRRYCPDCRLKKCLSVGMSPDAVKTRAKKRQNELAADYPEQEGGNDVSDGTYSAAPMRYEADVSNDRELDVNVTIRLPQNYKVEGGPDIKRKLQEAIQAALEASPACVTGGISVEMHSSRQKHRKNDDAADEGVRRMASNAVQHEQDNDGTPLADHCIGSGLFPFCASTFGMEYQDLLTVHRPDILPMHLKYVKMEELLRANEEIRKWIGAFPPLEGSYTGVYTPSDGCKVIQYMLTHAINQHRRLAAFNQLPQADRAALVQANSSDITCIRLAMELDRATGRTKIGYPGCAVTDLDFSRYWINDMGKEILQFKLSFLDNFHLNDSVYVMLCAVALFNPDNVTTPRKAAIAAERQLYLGLLQDYLRSVLSEREAVWAYRYFTTWLNCLSLSVRRLDYRKCFTVDPSTLAVSNIWLKDWMT